MTTDDKRATGAADLADVLFTLMPMVVEHINGRLEDHDMTNTDYWALRSVDGPMPMKDLATCMNIDPSYVTLVADRLEERGLIERHAHPTDRRMKNLVPTKKGIALQKSIPDMLWSGPNTFSPITDTERTQLIGLLSKLISS